MGVAGPRFPVNGISIFRWGSSLSHIERLPRTMNLEVDRVPQLTIECGASRQEDKVQLVNASTAINIK